jgi:hypothetical protein
MPQNTTRSKESIASLPAVGTDTEGATHHWDWYRDTVYVLADGDIDHVEYLDAGQLPEWIAYVRHERGWVECRYVDGDLADATVRMVES